MTYVISGTTSSLVSLTAADNPASIASGGLLQAGLYAPSLGAAWSIANAGTVLGEAGAYNGAGSTGGAGGAGVVLITTGTLINLGTIAGGYGASGGTGGGYGSSGAGGAGAAGVSLAGGGTLTNGGTIAGGAGGGGGGGNDDGGAGGAGGAGVSLAGGSLGNTGTIDGGAGGSGGGAGSGSAGAGAIGGAGVSFATSGTLTNSGTIGGGAGGSGGGSGSGGIAGGTGGAGVAFADGGTLSNSGTIAGGVGGGGAAGGGGTGGTGGTGGAGVSLLDGGTLNNSSGMIAGGTGGAGGSGGGGSSGGGGTGGAGVFLASGGTLTNGGAIVGGAGNNAGSSPHGGGGGGAGGAGIDLASGGTLTNLGTVAGGVGGAGGDVSFGSGGGGGSGGVGVALTGGTLANFGTISGGAGGAGGTSGFGGSAGGHGGGGAGVAFTGGGTMLDAGAILGADGADAVYFGPGAARLILDPGASFYGNVVADAALTNVLELASSTTQGTLSGAGTQFTGFGQTTIDAGASWTLTGANYFAAATTLTNAGTLAVAGANLTDAGSAINDGTLVLDSSTVTLAALTGTGQVAIGAGITLVVQGAVSSGETIAFAGSGGYLHIDEPGSFAGTITGFAVTGEIDLAGVAPGSVSYAAGLLNYGGSQPIALSASPPAPLTASASPDGALLLSALCFCAGTRIRTPHGDVPVQTLKAGDTVNTWSGGTRPITWIGTGNVLATRGRRSAATPVIVRKGALADNVPCRGLRVTKGHSLLVDGVLIPVEFLVNHRSILWDDRAQEVALYHVELDRHDVMIADGAPAESYRDDGNRWLFHNANSGWDQPPLAPCAEVLTGGPAVDAAWRRILDRAGARPGFRLTDDPDLHLLIDDRRVDPRSQHGDAYRFAVSARPTAVRIVSRAGVPAELGVARDPRSLGIALRRIELSRGARLQVMHAADDRLAEGFHAFEAESDLRWTNGDAALPAALFRHCDGPAELVLHVAGTTHYPLDAAAARAA